MTLRVAVVAQESAGIQTVRLVAGSAHRLVCVLTDPAREPSPATTVAVVAGKLGVDVLDPSLVRDPSFAATLEELCVDVLLNVHSLHVACADVVTAPRIGSFNLHPGPLPAYPGLNAPSWAISRGETGHACTVHWMTGDVDAGPVAYAATFPVDERDTGLTLTARCVRAGLPLLARLLDDAARGGRAAVPAESQRGGPLVRGNGPPYDGRVPWELPADSLAAFVRACDFLPFRSPWGHPRTSLDGAEIELLRAEAAVGSGDDPPGLVIGTDGEAALVSTGVGVLRVIRIRCDGEVAAGSSLLRPGARLSG
jgi:methionyl-tRNA formyltransferase